MRKGQLTHDALVKSSAALIRRRGYAATGLGEVLRDSGAPKGSLYFHFPDGKEQLAQESVQRSVVSVSRAIERVLAEASDVADAMRRCAELLASNLTHSEYRDGCPVATITLEMASESQRIRGACAAGFERWQQQIADYLAGYGLHPAAVKPIAMTMICAFEGALMVARANHDTEPLRLVAEELAALTEVRLK